MMRADLYWLLRSILPCIPELEAIYQWLITHKMSAVLLLTEGGDALAHAEHAQLGDTRVSCNNQQVVIALGGRELALL